MKSAKMSSDQARASILLQYHDNYFDTITSMLELDHLVTSNPEHREHFYERGMMSNFERFTYGGLNRIAALVDLFPGHENAFYEMVKANEKLWTFSLGHVEHVAELIEIFPSHKDDLYKEVCTDEGFKRITCGSVDALARLVATFPEHANDFYAKVNSVEKLKHFAFSCAEEVAKLIGVFPDHKEELNSYARSNGIDLAEVTQRLQQLQQLQQLDDSSRVLSRFSLFPPPISKSEEILVAWKFDL